MWFITLVVLALAAYFIIKAISASSKRKAIEQQPAPELKTDRAPPPTAQSSAAAPSSGQPSTPKPGAAATATSSTAIEGLETGNTLKDAQEMIKILNLAGSDAGRLGISNDEFQAIRAGDSATLPDDMQLQTVADKLRRMLA